MGLSSDVLWHQTNKSALVNILNEMKLRYGYALETIFQYRREGFAIPIISMCDLPFSELHSYLGKYGGYVIGLSSDWGKRNAFTPVWYNHKESGIVKMLSSLYTRSYKAEDLDTAYTALRLMSYIKLVEGTLKRREYKKYRFYDEREVRNCPTIEEFQDLKLTWLMNKSEYEKFKEDNGGTPLLSVGVNFEWSDVKYIIVDKESEVDEFNRQFICNNAQASHVQIFYATQVLRDFIGAEHNVKLENKSISVKPQQSLKISLTREELEILRGLNQKLKNFENEGSD